MHTPTTPTGGGPGAPVPGGMYKFPSVSSIHSMVSMGYLPPGHGYVPKKPKPDKPYGPTFVSVMNRTWRGPGRKYINYALFFFGISLLFYSGGALYFGHRNVTRLRVLRTEVLGAMMVAVGILCTGAMFHFLHKARVESNRWRSNVKFKSEGLFTAAAVNYAYVPDDDIKLASGTYGPRALKEIPRPSRGRAARSKVPSLSNLRQGGPPPTTAGRMYEKKQARSLEGLAEEGSRGDIYTLEEGEEPEAPRHTSSAAPSAGPSQRSSAHYDEDIHDAPTMPRGQMPPQPNREGEPIPRHMPPMSAEPSPRPMMGEPMARPMIMPDISARPSMPEPMSRTPIGEPSLPPSGSAFGLPRQQPLPPVHRPPPQVFRPSPQAWKSGSPGQGSPAQGSPAAQSSPAATGTPSMAYPPGREIQKTWTPPKLPPVQRAPVSTLKSPQPTIQLQGATPRAGPSSESEL